MYGSVALNTAIDDIPNNADKEAYLRRWLEDCSRSTKEIDIIFKHFLDGGMLSEIIAPSEKAFESGDEELIGKSIQALQDLSWLILREKEKNKDFRNDLIENLTNKLISNE